MMHVRRSPKWPKNKNSSTVIDILSSIKAKEFPDDGFRSRTSSQMMKLLICNSRFISIQKRRE